MPQPELRLALGSRRDAPLNANGESHRYGMFEVTREWRLGHSTMCEAGMDAFARPRFRPRPAAGGR